ncbi:M55 family metallopeptidase [Ruthenibacterium lactatiformans]|uniref:M55 family metallopeptidase n=1 Tax=Ruthenibacterium lactatiformans TaxID=1550024 RepID=UPI0019676B1E|nr:M55 family metallopeptidase [Ruthenibacterium lactatiformans]
MPWVPPAWGSETGKIIVFACREATREADTAARALFDSGADEVIVWDAHDTGINLDYDLLDTRCRILLGAGHKGCFVGLDKTWTAVLFIGYHAMGGTQDAVLAHAFSSKTIQHYKLNGEPAAELAIDAAYVGAFGVPVLFCASDDKCIAEAKQTFGPIATVETKRSLSWSSALSRHPAAVCQDIYSTVLQAAKEGQKVAPYTLPSPLSVEIRYPRTDLACHAALTDIEGKPFAFADAFTRTGVVESVQNFF